MTHRFLMQTLTDYTQATDQSPINRGYCCHDLRALLLLALLPRALLLAPLPHLCVRPMPQATPRL